MSSAQAEVTKEKRRKPEVMRANLMDVFMVLLVGKIAPVDISIPTEAISWLLYHKCFASYLRGV